MRRHDDRSQLRSWRKIKMLGFELTEEQLELKALAKKFTAQEIIPRAREYDEKEIFPEDVCEKAFAAGLMNFGVPKEFGGPGLGILDTCIIQEETQLRLLR